MKFKNLVLLNGLVVFFFGAAFVIRPFGPSEPVFSIGTQRLMPD